MADDKVPVDRSPRRLNLRSRGVRFWAVTVTAASVIVLWAGSQIARAVGQDVNWYTGFGQWLGALASFIAAGAALWISMSDRRNNIEDRRRLEREQQADLERQAGLVRITAEMLGRSQAAGPSIRTPSVGIHNRRADPIFDIDILKFIHHGQELELKPAFINGFAISPPRPSQKHWYQEAQLRRIALAPDELLVIYQQDDLPGTPADYVAVQYTDRSGARWEVDTAGAVKRF
ncbi:hypothetical protein [Mycobacterium sp. AT1]|uniref:hypothetical protein n=1 Tax=Mycobacterium sp. AT1 TaxID=1961706 RepID=UPI0009ABD109|nr:hypothetical protein [Mycobacterium sp. AT1]OPX12980.1 hypothetical protein B1790_02025 [Mycobacterium sp. AT1]